MLTPTQGIALLRLYETEISKVLECLYLDPDKAKDLDELLPLGRVRQLCEEYDNRTDFAKQLMRELFNSPMNRQLYPVILHVLVTLGEKYKTLHMLLSCTNEYLSRSRFNIILDNLEEFMKYTVPLDVMLYVKDLKGYEEITNLLIEEIEKVNDEMLAKKLVLRNIPQINLNSVYDIMHVISKHDKSGEQFIEKLYPGFSTFYYRLLNNRDSLCGIFAVCPSNESIKTFITQLGTPALKANPRYKIVDLRTQSLPKANDMERMIVKSLESRLHVENPIVLRDYQTELCEHAVQGKNSLITAPTGSGKTVIGAHIIKNHFHEMKDKGNRFKALFLTPNTVLLEQQALTFREYMGHLTNVTVIQGSSDNATRESVLSSDVIVATPQMIVNLCKEHLFVDSNALINPPPQFYLSTFTLILFDECHSTQKNSPYSVLMKIYHGMKNTKMMPSDHTIPQIIGLTASLGVGTAKNVVQAVSHITDICANLDIDEISMVHKYRDELLRFSPVIPDICILCSKSSNPSLMLYSNVLSQFMGDLETIFRECLDNYTVNKNLACDFVINDPPKDKTLPIYQTWIGQTKRDISESRLTELHHNKKVYGLIEILENCHLSHINNWNFNSNIAFNYLSDFMKTQIYSMDNGISTLWKQYELELQKYRADENSMLSGIEKLVLEQYEENTDFRGIIFVKTQQGAMILSDILNTLSSLSTRNIKTNYITGVNSGNDTGSTTIKNLDKLAKFSSGDIRLLVATSVAEEGLDIAKCNIVIKYNYTTNEIAHVQRRGRGRAANSRCILITNCEKLRDKEENNRQKEQLMKKSLQYIFDNRISFKDNLKIKKREIWNKILEEETSASENVVRLKKSGIIYRILCKKCHNFLCTNEDIRVRNGGQYFICTPNIWSLITLLKNLSPSLPERTNLIFAGKMACKNCGFSLGLLTEIQTSTLPTVDAKAIVLEWEGTDKVELKSVKKWKEITEKYFVPNELRSYDLATMRKEL